MDKHDKHSPEMVTKMVNNMRMCMGVQQAPPAPSTKKSIKRLQPSLKNMRKHTHTHTHHSIHKKHTRNKKHTSIFQPLRTNTNKKISITGTRESNGSVKNFYHAHNYKHQHKRKPCIILRSCLLNSHTHNTPHQTKIKNTINGDKLPYQSQSKKYNNSIIL